MFSHSSEYKKKYEWIISVAMVFAIVFSYTTPFTAIAEGDEEENAQQQEEQAQQEEDVQDNTNTSNETNNGTEVSTGDATSVGDVANEVNTNETDIEQLSNNEEQEQEESTNANSEIEVSNENEAEVGNDVEIVADTGVNEAGGDGNEGSATIETGDAVAIANTLNVVNTNIYNSHGLFIFLNNLMNGFGGGHVDLRDLEFFNANAMQTSTNGRNSAQSNPCESICGNATTSVTNTNDATITNDVVVRANTGGNTANGGNGSGHVTTGNAYAAANVINVANTNIVDSNYLLMTFNNFGSLNGDLVFPAAQAFMDIFGNTAAFNNTNIQSTNTASVESVVSSTADTGGNEAGGGAVGGFVNTGDASATGNVVNQVNQNLIGGGGFQILLRVHGSWAGNIFGAPEELSWRETGSGIELLLDSPDGGSGVGVNNTSIQNTNNATITNNIDVVALTGDNKAEGDGGGSVDTGNAYTGANAINVANTNVVGRNWMLAIVDIFGDWNGDITFGRPDLWIGTRAELHSAGGVAEPGDMLTYHFTVANNGDVDAHNVKLKTQFNPQHLMYPEYKDRVAYESDSDGSITWNIGTIPAGGYKEFSYKGSVTFDIPLGKSFIENVVSVESQQEEDNIENNSDVISFETWRENKEYTHGAKIHYTPSPKLSITKNNSTGGKAIQSGNPVTYDLVVENSGAGSAYNAVLVDSLYAEDGTLLYEETWDLGEIFAGERIEISYDTFFNKYTPTGKYINKAKVYAYGEHSSFLYGRNRDSNTAESVVHILGQADPETLKAIEQQQKARQLLKENPPEIVPESQKIQEIQNAVDIVASRAWKLLAQVEALNGRHFAQYTDENDNSVVVDHPVFTQHPVRHRVDGPVYEHPIFTQEPVYMQHTYFIDPAIEETATIFPWIENVAASEFFKFISLPFGDLTFEWKGAQPISQDSEENKGMLALLALSMFVLRKPDQKG